MTMKYILAVALIAPFLTVSSMAQQHVYQGGPKLSVPHTTRQIGSGADIYAMGVQSQEISRLSRWPANGRAAWLLSTRTLLR